MKLSYYLKTILLLVSLNLFTGCPKNTFVYKENLHPLTVEGKLQVDTVWEGEIFVEDKIIIPLNVTLFIKPGTKIYFKKTGYKQFGFGDNRIYVQKGGKLIAEGTSDKPIIFTSGESNPQKSDWHGIEFHSENNQSILKYCEIEYAYEAIACILSSPQISNCIITKNEKAICLWQKSEPIIKENFITENNVGIVCSTKSEPDIISNRIENNKTCGIYCEKGSRPKINKNKISKNNYGIKNIWDVSPDINENSVINNEYGIFYELSGLTGTLNHNIIENNKFGIYGMRKTILNVVNNSIKKNEYGIFAWERTEGKINNNTITKNKYGIYCGRSSHLDIFKNNITDNTIGILCEFSSYPKINYNNIYNQAEYDIKLGENQSAEWTRNIWDKYEIEKWEKSGQFGFIDATKNWWGKKTTEKMDRKTFDKGMKNIYDYFSSPFCQIEDKNYERDKVNFRDWGKNEISLFP